MDPITFKNNGNEARQNRNERASSELTLTNALHDCRWGTELIDSEETVIIIIIHSNTTHYG